jgi:uncharacterized membrane protein YqjE
LFVTERSRSLPLQHCLVASLCLGLALANNLRISVFAALVGAFVLAVSIWLVGQSRFRLVATTALFVLLGLALGSLRLTSLDRSPLLPHVGESAKTRAVVVACFVNPEIL